MASISFGDMNLRYRSIREILDLERQWRVFGLYPSKNALKKVNFDLHSMEGTKPFFKSLTLHGVAITALGYLATQFGIPVLEGEIETLVVSLVTVVGLLVSITGRLRAATDLTVK